MTRRTNEKVHGSQDPSRLSGISGSGETTSTLSLGRAVRNFGLLTAFACVLFASYFQARAETYLQRVRRDYGIFMGPRENCTPFLVHYLLAKANPSNYLIFQENIHLPYYAKGLNEGYYISPAFGSYFMYVYYDANELEVLDLRLTQGVR
jgi:hypothetical protein